MRKPILTATFAASLALIANSAIAADAAPPENLLAGTRWMEIQNFDTVEKIAPEKMLLLRLCAIADIAFVIEEGKLTKYDRAGLSGKSGPVAYAKVDTEPGADGATHLTLHTAIDGTDAPDNYLVDADGEIMRLQTNGANASAYMKCRMRT